MTEVLNRKYGLENNMDPTGKVWVPAKVNAEQGLWCVAIKKDEKLTHPQSPPEYLEGKFTTADRAKEQIDRYLTEMWDMSDRQAAKNVKEKVA